MMSISMAPHKALHLEWFIIEARFQWGSAAALCIESLSRFLDRQRLHVKHQSVELKGASTLSPSILQVYMTDDHLVIVMEYASGGTIEQRVQSAGPLPEEKARVLFLQLVSALEYCHSRRSDSGPVSPAAL